MDISFASTALYYGMYLLGAGSIGYLIVRLSYPDVRLLDKDTKLGVSAILGFFVMCVSFAVEWVAGHAADFGLGLHSYQGLMPMFSCLLVVVTFGIMKLYFLMNSPRMLTVGLPIHSASKAAKAMELPPVPESREKPGKAAGFAQSASVQAAPVAPAAAFPSRTVASVTPSPSGLFGFIDLLFKKRVPQTVQKKQELVEVDVPIVQHVPGGRPQAGGQKQTTVQFTSMDLSGQDQAGFGPGGRKQPAGKPVQGPVKADANVPAPFVFGLQEKEFRKAKAGAGQAPSEKAIAKRPSFASNAAPFVSGITPEMVSTAKPGQKQAAAKPASEGDVPKDERSRKNYYDQKINELLSGFSTEDTERKVEPPAANPSEARPVFGDRPVKTRKDLEAESELMVEDLVPGNSPNRGFLAEPDERMRRRFEQPAEQEAAPQPKVPEPSESRRRLYARPSSIRVIAPRDVSETDEFADIITDIYSQLQSSAREDSLNDSMKVNVPPSSAGQQAPAKAGAAKGKFDDLESELFGTAKPAAAVPAAEGGVFDQLSRISAVEGPGKTPAKESGLKSSSDMEFVHIGNEAGMGCPTCHQKNSRIVFCPYCGSGMCTNCSPNVRVDAAGFIYSCPKCGEEVHIKKKSATPSGSF